MAKDKGQGGEPPETPEPPKKKKRVVRAEDGWPELLPDGTETGDPERPYKGSRGPRKTPPLGHPDRGQLVKKGQRERRIKSHGNVVRGLFGEEAGDAAVEAARIAANNRSPAQPTGKRVQKRRSSQHVRLGEKWTRVMDQIEAEGITMADFVKTLSPEELARGQLKNEAGQFMGAPTKWVPTEFHKQCIRELMARGKVLYQENYIEAIQSMTSIANDPRVDPGQRIRAAQFVIERIEGKVPEKLEIGVSEPWQDMLVGIVADIGAPVREFPNPAAVDTDAPLGYDPQ